MTLMLPVPAFPFRLLTGKPMKKKNVSQTGRAARVRAIKRTGNDVMLKKIVTLKMLPKTR